VSMTTARVQKSCWAPWAAAGSSRPSTSTIARRSRSRLGRRLGRDGEGVWPVLRPSKGPSTLASHGHLEPAGPGPQ
ncbi:hypothetical protein AK812_SmicGene47674, partial [Symbiodinium microadriaticum]